ncbi:hypothetical protein [Streptomyces sp. NPDC093094]|uniref:hypothetical protein n=1 Tax=Streptomyces sp. NPDC093094 TaxID=3366026 RepID=UPI003800A76B
MAHPLMVESRVGPMSRLLPRAVREGGHTFTFLTRDLHHHLRSAPEADPRPAGLRNAPGVLEVQLAEPGQRVSAAAGNNGCLGHVMAGGAKGPGARERGEALLGELRSRTVIR